MTEEKANLFIKYCQHKSTISNQGYYAGKNILDVLLFLEGDYSPNKAGYRKFCKEHPILIAESRHVKDSILDFLNWRGIGFSKKQKPLVKENTPTLTKISVITEKNLKLVGEFANWMSINTDYSRCTIQNYLGGIKQFFRYSTDFSTDACKSYLATLEKEGRAPATINLRANCLTAFGAFLKKPVVLKKVKIPRMLHTENIPTVDEYNKLLDYLWPRNKQRYFDVKILATTGARISEYLQMRWEDIASGEVTLKGKGSKYRHFFFSKDLIAEARSYMKDTGSYGLVCRNKMGDPMSSRGLATAMKSWSKPTGIDRAKLHPHAFRHFFAKMYLKKNKDVVQLAELLGHSSIDTTRIYLQKSHEEQKREFNRNVTW